MTKSGRHCGKRRNCSFWAISFFVTMFSKSRLLQRRRKASIWGKGLNVSILDSHYFLFKLYCLRRKPVPTYKCLCTTLRRKPVPTYKCLCTTLSRNTQCDSIQVHHHEIIKNIHSVSEGLLTYSYFFLIIFETFISSDCSVLSGYINRNIEILIERLTQHIANISL